MSNKHRKLFNVSFLPHIVVYQWTRSFVTRDSLYMRRMNVSSPPGQHNSARVPPKLVPGFRFACFIVSKNGGLHMQKENLSPVCTASTALSLFFIWRVPEFLASRILIRLARSGLSSLFLSAQMRATSVTSIPMNDHRFAVEPSKGNTQFDPTPISMPRTPSHSMPGLPHGCES